uniref:Bestrophin homolog n=1 Tax=Syphacia muris TaxID=451379 RepID=A0A0N5AGE2_9BILA
MSPVFKPVSRIICGVGVLSLLYCAYSAAQQPFINLPVDLVCQIWFSLLAILYGSSQIAGDFIPLRTDWQDRFKSWDTAGNCPSFYIFNHRAKARSLRLRHFKASYEAFQHCMKLVKARDYSNYVGALLHPTTLQPEIFALLAFNVEVAVVRDQIKRNSGVTGIYRLQFWKDTVEAIYLNPNAPLPRQPVATALASYVKLKDAKLLIDLITSRQHTLGDRPYTALSDICDYGRNTTGALLKLIMNVLLRKFYCADTARKDDECLMKCYEAAENMGAAVGIVTILRLFFALETLALKSKAWLYKLVISVAPLLSRGILLLPVDLMTTYNVKVGRKSLFDGEITFLLRDMANEAKVRLLNSRKLKDVIPKELRMPLMASGTTVDFVLSVLEESKYNLLDARLQRNPELLAWRLWWKKMNKVY